MLLLWVKSASNENDAMIHGALDSARSISISRHAAILSTSLLIFCTPTQGGYTLNFQFLVETSEITLFRYIS